MKLFTTAFEMCGPKSGKMVKKGQILIFIKSLPLICQNEPLDVRFSELLVSRGQPFTSSRGRG